MAHNKTAPIIALVVLTVVIVLAFILSRASSTPQWADEEWAVINSLSLNHLPKDMPVTGNAYLGDQKAIAFGERLFFDKRLSQRGTVSCANCHQPDNYFTDGKVIALGETIGKRNTPSLHGVAYNDWFFWDGRKDSLWSQALAPLENPVEHNLTRTDVVRFIINTSALLESYQQLFGKLDAHTFDKLPADAQPAGTIEQIKRWKRLSQAERETVDQTFANIGKSIAAYVATLPPVETRFDDYVAAINAGDTKTTLLNPQELAGLRLFIKPESQCINCHFGPLFTNQSFHNIGTGEAGTDSGRAAIIGQLRLDRFNCLGPHSDADEMDCGKLTFMNRDRHALWGSYKTPTLRNVSNTAPYFHDGRSATLEAVLDHYTQLNAGEAHMQPIQFSSQEKQYLVAFLKTLAAKNNKH